MSGTVPSLEELNAYVDNELSQEQAADVALAIARDPETARKVALLARLRSVVPGAIDTPELSLPAPKSRWPKYAAMLAAACVAFIIAGAGILFYLSVDRTDGGDWLNAAWQLHDAWDGPSPDVAATPSPIRVARQGADLIDAYVPDLSAAKLSVVHVETQRTLGGARAVVIGYAGTRGCKLTLVAAMAPGPLVDEPRFFAQGGRTAYGWRVGKLGYLLVAEGMARERLDLITDIVRRASLRRLPLDEVTRTALMENRRDSKPCLA